MRDNRTASLLRIRGAASEVVARSFWLLPSAAMVAAAGLGFAAPALDDTFNGSVGPFTFPDAQSARTVLATIATVTVSVGGISFSVTVVALQLASQQLSPRVLRTFQSDRLSQATLAALLGTAVYCLIVLATIGGGGTGTFTPNLSMTLAVLLAVVSLGMFAAFIHHTVQSLQASTLIRRMASDAHEAIARAYPSGIGEDPDDPAAARSRAEVLTGSGAGALVRAPRAGYLVAVDGRALIEAAAGCDGLVAQRVPVGDFVLTGTALAEAWARDGDAGALAEKAQAAFELSQERTLVQDVAFPIRQLADVALRGISPSLNDPTTAENAMSSLADTLIRVARVEPVANVRVDGDGAPRFVARVPDVDDLVRLGFDQVRVKAAPYPLVAARLIELLGLVEEAAGEAGRELREPRRQIQLLREGVSEVPTGEDERRVTEA